MLPALTVPVVPVVWPVLEPVLWMAVELPVEPLALPALPTLPVLPTAPPTLPVVVALLVLTPVLGPVLSLSTSSCFAEPLTLILSSPLPDLPPATSPRESELPSPASL